MVSAAARPSRTVAGSVPPPVARRPPSPTPPEGRRESRPRWTSWHGLFALVALVALGFSVFALWHRRLADEPPSTRPAITLAPTTSTAPPPTSSVPPASPSLPPQESPRPAAPRVNTPAPVAEDAAEIVVEATPGPAADAARLLIDFEHALKSGTMRLWLDDKLVLQEDLEGRVRRKVVGLTWRSGGFEKEIAVPPGRHTLRVRVSWEGNDKSDSLIGTLEPGESRRVEIRVGRLRKNVSAEWK
jgi:hypothetical protein